MEKASNSFPIGYLTLSDGSQAHIRNCTVVEIEFQSVQLTRFNGVSLLAKGSFRLWFDFQISGTFWQLSLYISQ